MHRYDMLRGIGGSKERFHLIEHSIWFVNAYIMWNMCLMTRYSTGIPAIAASK